MQAPLISTKAKFAEVLAQALPKAKEISASLPDDPFQKSVLAQLEFMAQSLANGHIPTYDERQRINIGVIAMRTLEDSFPDYASLLSELDYAFNRWEALS